MFIRFKLYHILITGAIPPKRKYINYKELMEQRKEEKLKKEEEKQSMIAKSVLTTGIKKKKNVKNDVGHLLSNYGKVFNNLLVQLAAQPLEL